MGACLSTHESGQSCAPHLHKGPAPFDSVWSVAEKQQTQQHKHQKKHKGSTKTASKHVPQQQQAQQQQKQKRRPQVDITTGEVIPDFGVHGVFDVLYELGSGGSGQTYLCRDLESGKVVAVKFVPRPLTKAAIPFMMAEVQIQAELGEGSLNLITMHEIILTRTHLALVLEYASGGSLTEKVAGLWESALQRGGLFMEEQEASYYLRQFVHSIHFCHKRRVAHRDLKLDNTLLEECIVGPPRLKICDFGFARRWSGVKDTMHDAIGTPVYMSPQMLAARQCTSGYSGIKADMWAVGILLFVMLLGSFPFDHDEKSDPNSSAAANEVWLKQQQQGWRKNARAAEVLRSGVLSEECCDLLDKLLMVDEDKRASSGDILHHPWLHIPLTQQQEEAWQRLQQQQSELDQQLRDEGNPRLAKLRSEAMFAMMAIAAKPPGKSLFPVATALSGSLHSAHSASSTDQAGGSITAGVAAADSAAAQSPTAAAAAAAAVDGEDDLGVHNDAMHMSLMAGEGVRTSTLEEKVEVYRQQQQQQASIKSVHSMAAAAVPEIGSGCANDQQQQHSGHVIFQHGSSSSNSRDSAAAADHAPSPPPAAAVVSNKGRMGNLPSAKRLFSPKDTGNSIIKSTKSPFAGLAAVADSSNSSSSGRAAAAAPAGSEGSDGDADAPDAVWRLPLSSTVDASVFNLTPELHVAAGALIRQLQKSGEKIAGRGRSSRSSCPMY